MKPRAALLYDRNCGFCRWAVARILVRDSRQVLLPVAIQSAEGRRLLTGMPEDRRLETWHLVRLDGTLLSAGAVLPELSRLLGMRWRARVLTAPGVASLGYRAVAGRRRLLGLLLVTAGARNRADELIAQRAPAPFASPAAPAAETPALAPAQPAFRAAPSAEPAAAQSLQQRFESSDFGRGLITAFLIVTLITIVATNLPNSAIRRHLMRPGQPYLNALGLDQNWALFAPDPRRSVIDFNAVVRYDDGSAAVWRFPHNDALVGAYRDYRWRKWAENVDNMANSVLWRPAAVWVAGQMTRAGRRELTVTLVRRWANLTPPGQSPSQGPWHTQSFYTLHVRS